MSFQSLEVFRPVISNLWKFSAIASLVVCASAANAMTNAASPAKAQPPVDETKYSLAATNVLTEQLYAFVTAAEIAGTIADDAMICAITDAKVSGTISNDLWMAGMGAVEVSGRVGDHARLAGRTVDVSGTLARSLVAAGQSVHLATNSSVAEDAFLVGVNVTTEGHVGSNLLINAVSVTIGGHVRGDAKVNASDIVVLPNTKIDGDLIYTSSKELFLDKSVALGGKLKRETPVAPPMSALVAAQMTGLMMQIVGTMLAGIFFVLLFPRFTGNSVRLLRHAPWRCSITGSVAFLVMPLTAILAVSTIAGAQLGLSIAAAYGLMLYLGNIVVALAIGGVMMRQHGPQPVRSVLMTLAVGLFALYTLKALPYIGLMVGLYGWFAGLGALLLNLLHSQRMILPPDLPQPGETNQQNPTPQNLN